MSELATPKLDVFRELLQQVEALDTELSSLDTATRDRDAIKARMSECQDEDEARKLLKNLARAEEDVTVKGIRRPRLQTDLAELLTTAEKASNAALNEASGILGRLRQESVAAFEHVLQDAQHETERPRVRQANDDAAQALTVPTLVERQQRTLQTAHCSIGMKTVPLSDRVRALQSSLVTLDRAQTAQIDIAAEAARLTAACAAFRKSYAKG